MCACPSLSGGAWHERARDAPESNKTARIAAAPSPAHDDDAGVVPTPAADRDDNMEISTTTTATITKYTTRVRKPQSKSVQYRSFFVINERFFFFSLD